MKSLLLTTCLMVSAAVSATPSAPLEQQISSITTEEVTQEDLRREGLAIQMTSAKSLNTTGGFTDPNIPVYPGSSYENRVDTAGRVISVARDMVALGEAIYQLVSYGKPSNVTEYAPISVVPRDPMTKEYIDPFDLEGFSMPVEKNFITRVKNGSGKEVVKFAYKVIYSYGGSYNSAGKYLTNVLIVPSSVLTRFGWSFNASMRLSGIMNHGSRAHPIAGIMVTVKYQMNSWSTAFERNDTIHITGNGQLKNHNVK